jgi:hypothetical protein
LKCCVITDAKTNMFFYANEYIGVDKEGVLRSLPLPNLSKVTRESTKEYFDNSWTLFEVSFRCAF